MPFDTLESLFFDTLMKNFLFNNLNIIIENLPIFTSERYIRHLKIIFYK